MAARDLLVVEHQVRLDGAADRDGRLGERDAQPGVRSAQHEQGRELLIETGFLKPAEIVANGFGPERADLSDGIVLTHRGSLESRGHGHVAARLL